VWISEKLSYLLEKRTYNKTTCETFNIPKKNLPQLDKPTTTNRLPPTKKPHTQKKNRPQKPQQYIKEHPDACLKELSEHFNVKPSSMHVTLVKLKITRKKTIYIQ
jgi:hypothetical protein